MSYATRVWTYISVVLRGPRRPRTSRAITRFSLTVTPSYTDWNSIRGLSIGGLAERVTAPSQVTLVEALFFRKFPFVVQYAPEDREDLAFYKIVPKVFSVLDYTKSFGHTDLVTIAL